MDQVLSPGAAQGSHHSLVGFLERGRVARAASAEIGGGVEDGHRFAVSRQGNIRRVSVEMRCCEDVGAVDGGALRFVDRGGVAVVKVAVHAGVYGDACLGGGVEFDLQNPSYHVLNGTQGAVLDPKASFVAQEVQAVAGGVVPRRDARSGWISVVGSCCRWYAADVFP